MALIPCPKCGADISDKAKKCPSCGFVPVIKICEDCGGSFFEGASMCPHCGCPMDVQVVEDVRDEADLKTTSEKEATRVTNNSALSKIRHSLHRKKKKILLSLMALLGCLAIGLLIYVWVRRPYEAEILYSSEPVPTYKKDKQVETTQNNQTKKSKAPEHAREYYTTTGARVVTWDLEEGTVTIRKICETCWTDCGLKTIVLYGHGRFDVSTFYCINESCPMHYSEQPSIVFCSEY